jgi:hypothetical protein
MPAWMAGIQSAKMPPQTSMETWIPALHARVTRVTTVLRLVAGKPEDPKIQTMVTAQLETQIPGNSV